MVRRVHLQQIRTIYRTTTKTGNITGKSTELNIGTIDSYTVTGAMKSLGIAIARPY